MDINKKIKIFKKPLISLKHICIAITVILGVLTVMNGLNVVLSFVRVGDIEIRGDYTPYDGIEVRQGTKIKSSTFWLAVDEKEIEERMMKEMPYFSEVKVTKKFPNTIVLNVESRAARWYIDISGVKYAVDKDLYVIEETQNVGKATKLILPELKRVEERKLVEFSKDSETTLKETLKIFDTIRSTDLRKRITELDIHDRTDIRMTIDGKYEAYLGDAEDLSEKILDIESVLEQENVKNSNGGKIYAYTDTPVSFRAYS